jgi:hypothetical protein
MTNGNPSKKAAGIESLKFAGEVCKQIITLSTGIIALSVTFAKDLLPAGTMIVPTVIKLAWLGYGIAILAAVATMMTLAGAFHQIEQGNEGFDINRPNVRIFAVSMVVAFVAGIGLTIAAGWTAVR